MFDDVDYQLCHTNLGPNETLLLGSDGIWEVSGLHEQEFGIERLRAKFEEAVGNADDIGDHLVHSVLEYAAGGPPEDDMCLVCIQRVE